jgi:para-nitrobenzyl esterase
MRAALLVLMCANVAGSAVHAKSSPSIPLVTIDSGVLEGIHFSSNSGDVAFLGIPYAAAPVGALRWLPPQPPPPWQRIRRADAFGPACPQLPSPWLPEMLGRKQMVTDEACLFLNVWTTNLHGAKKLPVMVWIHGGGNIEGSQEWPPLGPVLAKHGVVVVAINYRLGVFGYFSHPALTAESPHHSSGNYGLLDQIAALQWLRRNIANFGGDPQRVTVFGASSGSLDICDLLASPLADGLFQGAILQSGVCVDGLAPMLDRQEADGKRIAADLGAADDSQALMQLRAIPADELLRRAANEKNVDFNPVLDGWVFHEQPAIVFEKGRQAKVPVVVGSNADEDSIFKSPLVGGKSHDPKTVEAYHQWLIENFGARAQQAFEAYPAKADHDVAQAILNLETDRDFGFGSRMLAREVTASGQRAYLYNFTYVGSGPFEALGSFHSEESILLSKKFWTSWVSSPDDEKLSNILIAYWTQFAKAGAPDEQALPPWPPYDPKTDQAQELGRHVGQIPALRAWRFKVFEEMLRAELHR